jgi:hypothetical protein
MQDIDFAARLKKACDDNQSVIPPYGLGRQVVIARKLKVSQEAVRKWFSGESRPRVKLMAALAQFLGVDQAWLALGIEPDMKPEDKRFYSRRTEGVVYLALGMSMLDGASCAKPSDTDPRKGFVDYYMILNGEQVAVHTTLGREIDEGKYEFLLPHEYAQVRNVGFVGSSSTRIHMLDLATELINKHKEKKGGGYAVTMKAKSGVYSTGQDKWPRLNSLGELV